MPNYRLYRLDIHSGHFMGTEEIYAANDVSAIHMILQRADGTCVELWDGGRKVTRVDTLAHGVAFLHGSEALAPDAGTS